MDAFLFLFILSLVGRIPRWIINRTSVNGFISRVKCECLYTTVSLISVNTRLHSFNDHSSIVLEFFSKHTDWDIVSLLYFGDCICIWWNFVGKLYSLNPSYTGLEDLTLQDTYPVK